MQHVIIVIHLMLVLALIGVVLLQRSEGGGLGIGSTGGFMTSRGTANVLTRATAILAGSVLRDEPLALDSCRYRPQADIDTARRRECSRRAGCAGTARKRRWSAKPVARRNASVGAGNASSPIGAAGAAVEMKSRSGAGKSGPFSIMGA